MTGYKLLVDAVRLIGLEEPDENIKIIGMPLINTVLSELGFMPVSSLGEEVGVLSPAARQAVLFGTAALIANGIGDSDSGNTMTLLYRAKRSALKGRIARVKNTFPGGEC